MGFFFSFLLHVAVILAAFLGLPFLKPAKPDIMPEPIPVEIIDLSEMRDLTKKPVVEKQIPKQPKKPKKKTAPLPPPVEVPPPSEQSLLPPPPKNKENAALVPTAPKVAEVAPIPQKAPKRKKKKTPPKKKKPSELTSLLKDLTDRREEITAPKGTENMSPLEQRVLAHELSRVKQQIESNWNIPIGAENANNLQVELVITVMPDKRVRKVTVKNMARYRRDPFFRTAADSAIRAVNLSSPLQLPEGKHHLWKEIHLTFDPQDML